MTDKFANQLQTAVAKSPGISRLPAMVEYLVKRIFRRVGRGRTSYLMSTWRWYNPDLQ
jgi:hypothetical protein